MNRSLKVTIIIITLSIIASTVFVGCTTKPQIVNFSEKALTLPNHQNPEIVFIVPPYVINKIVRNPFNKNIISLTYVGDTGVPIRNALIEKFKDYNIKTLDTNTEERIHAPAVVKIWIDEVEAKTKMRYFPWPANTSHVTYYVTVTDINNNWSEKLKVRAWGTYGGWPEDSAWASYKNASEKLVKEIYKLLIKKGTIKEKKG
ncbi:MAG: hypothetical protein AB1488_06575 [Nitrospirota bacterium]